MSTGNDNPTYVKLTRAPEAMLFEAALASQELCEGHTWRSELLFWGGLLIVVAIASTTLSDQVEPDNAPFLAIASIVVALLALASGIYSAWYRARLVKKAPGAALLLGARTAPETAGEVARSISRLVFMTRRDRALVRRFEELNFLLPLLLAAVALPLLLVAPFSSNDIREYVLLVSLVPAYFFLSTIVRLVCWRAFWAPRLAGSHQMSMEAVLALFGFKRTAWGGWTSTGTPIFYQQTRPSVGNADQETESSEEDSPPQTTGRD